MIAVGLRARKKQQTRDRISAIATQLFATQGFDRTTIAEVAAAAEVAKMTVTNYFPLKEDLVFDRRDEIVQFLARATASRPAGTLAVDAIEAAYLRELERSNPTLGHLGEAFARMVQASPALVAHEQRMFAAQEAALADALILELDAPPDDLGPRVAAAHIAGIIRILYFEGRRRLLAGEATATIAAALDRGARKNFASLRAL